MGVALSDYGERGDRARNKMMAGSIIIFFLEARLRNRETSKYRVGGSGTGNEKRRTFEKV